MRTRWLLLGLLLVLPSWAADPPSLHGYRWKSRAQLELKGNLISEVLSELSIDADGHLHRKLLTERADEPARTLALQQRGITMELLDELDKLMTDYQRPPRGRLEGFLERVPGRPIADSDPPLLELEGTAFMQRDDEVRLEVLTTGRQLHRLEARATCLGSQLKLQITYQELESGLTAPSRTKARILDYDLNLTVRDFDYQK